MSKEGNPHRVLPYMIPSDMDKTLPLPPVPPMPSEGLVWALTKGYPWMPAILCNPDKDFQSHGDVARLPGFAGPNEL
ncbi:unnamed protein product [Aphanomyces euteiches]